jgi:hypothetical protein
MKNNIGCNNLAEGNLKTFCFVTKTDVIRFPFFKYNPSKNSEISGNFARAQSSLFTQLFPPTCNKNATGAHYRSFTKQG